MNDDQLEELFRHLPRDITPPRDPWPAVARRIRQPRRPWAAPLRIAAVLAIFLAGMVAGRLLSSRPDTERAADSPFLAAVEVQQAGTAYVQALRRLDAADDHDDPAIAQGRESARATLAAAEQLVPTTGRE